MIIVLIVLAIVVVLLFIAWACKKHHGCSSQPPIPVKEVEELTMTEILEFFKDKSVLDQLKAEPDLIAVAVRSKETSGVSVMLCIYDKQKSEVKTPLLNYKASRLDGYLLGVFGDKEMIVLQ